MSSTIIKRTGDILHLWSPAAYSTEAESIEARRKIDTHAELLTALWAMVNAAPFDTVNLGAPGSDARLAQEERREAMRMASAAIARAEGKAPSAEPAPNDTVYFERGRKTDPANWEGGTPTP